MQGVWDVEIGSSGHRIIGRSEKQKLTAEARREQRKAGDLVIASGPRSPKDGAIREPKLPYLAPYHSHTSA